MYIETSANFYLPGEGSNNRQGSDERVGGSVRVNTRVRMRRDFGYRLIEKYFDQLIDSVRVLRPHCRNSKANDFQCYCAAACAGTCQAHMRCTAAIGESVKQIWHNIFVYFWVLTRSRSVSLYKSSREFSSLSRRFMVEQGWLSLSLDGFCMFWPCNFAIFHIWNNRLFQMPFERVESATPRPNAWVFDQSSEH